jgi:hypothetical protein
VRGPSIDDVLAVLWAVCGLGIAAYFVVLGLQNRDMGVSPAPLLVLAGVVLVGFSIVAVRHARRGAEARAARNSGPLGGYVPGRPSPAQDPPTPEQRRATAPKPTAPPELSPRGRAELARVVGILDRAGLFRPRTPRPVDLVEAVADAGEPVTSDTVLAALWEGGYHHPGFEPDDHLGAVALHHSHTEQLEETLRGQVDDLARLTGAEIVVEDLQLTDTRTTMTLALVGRTTLDLAWASHPKYLSTVLHVAVARALPEVGLAWTWSDQGAWLGVPRGGVRALDAELGRAGDWALVADDEPMAAGEIVVRRD